MKKIIYIILLAAVPSAGFSQSDLQQLNTKVRNPFIKADEVDVVVSSLKKIQVSTTDTVQRGLLFETYRLSAERYAANNHFKQAYFLYQDYLSLKEKMLGAEKALLISQAVKSEDDQKQQTVDGIKTLKGEIAVLEKNEKAMQDREDSLIRNVSLLIILLTGLSLLLFLRISMKLKKVKAELLVARQQLLALEKTALLGRLKSQIEKSSRKHMDSIRAEITSIRALFHATEKALEKEQVQAFKKLKDLYAKAESDVNSLYE